MAATLLAAAPGSALAQDDLQPRVKCVQQQPYYFHAMPPDEATFSQAPPDADTPAAQPAATVNPVVLLPQFVDAVWSADFPEALCGPAAVTLHMALPPTAHLTVVAFTGDDPNDPASQVGGKTEIFPDGAVPDAALTLSIPLDEVTIDRLGWRVRTQTELATTGASATFYDHADYPSRFTLSALEPCDAVDEHPDCLLADLHNRVTHLAASGEVTSAGQETLHTHLALAQDAYRGGHAQAAVDELRAFQQAASDPQNVLTQAARDELVATAENLIAALQTA